jgi:outer membrane receptor protein involved in Fe transport
MFRNLSTFVLALLVGLPTVALAQGTGTLAGQVVDETGAGLPGANVVVEGTTLGAATDPDGNYRIIGVPVGTYTVTARFVGYGDVSQNDVTISSGYTRDLDFTLREGLELEGIEVVYERPIIENDAIGVPRTVTGEELQNLPVRGVQAVAALQGGVVAEGGGDDLFIRGGREQEVSYYVDGVKVQSTAVAGSGSLVGVNQGAVAEQEMLIGTIPARYGDVQSGVISITTRSGADRFFGNLEGITSEGLDSFGYNLAALSLGGPIVPQRLSFFLSGQGEFEADANPYGVDTYRLTDEAFAELVANPQVIRLTNATGDEQYVAFPWEAAAADTDGFTASDLLAALDASGSIPAGYELADPAPVNTPETFTADRLELGRGKDDPLTNLTFNGNLSANLTDALSLRIGGGYAQRDREIFTFGNSLYNQDIFNNDERTSTRLYGTFRHRLSGIAFYQLQAEFQDYNFSVYPEGFSSNVEDIFSYGDADDTDNVFAGYAQRYFVFRGPAGQETYQQLFTEDGGARPVTASGTFGLPGRTSLTTGNRFSMGHDQQFRLSGSATTQLSLHQIEFGAEYEQQTRRRYDITPFALARYAADGNVEGTVPGLPATGAANYGEIPFQAFRELYVSRYGYNYLGTEEVDDEDIDAYYDGTNSNIAPHNPIYYAGYIQDKIEYRDLVVNLGVRVDVFDNNALVLRDVFAPVPIVRVENLSGGEAPDGADPDWAVYFNDAGDIAGYRDGEGNFFDAGGNRVREEVVTESGSGQVERLREDIDDPSSPFVSVSQAFEDYTPQVTVMPRVGVSFPVTDRALFFASYNVTSQRPTEFAFAPFTSYEELTSQDSRVPNPRLEPEQTTQYELGFRQRLGERAAMTLSGFYRTQENKISNRTLPGGFPNYGTYLNADFTTTKGVEVGLELRRTRNLAINANYTLSFASGTGSDAGATANIVWRGEFFPDFISPADFDQRHTANLSVDYRFGDSEGPMIGGMRLLENFGINLLGQFATGQRFTPLESSIFSVNDTFTSDATGAINSGELPGSARIDLRVDRAFDLGLRSSTLKAYVWVQNLFDTETVLAVYRSTGLPDYDGYLDTEGGRSFLDSAADPAGRAFNYGAYTSGPVNIGGNQTSASPFFYGQPRRIRLGVLLNF